jgi:hypothetical protein
LSVPQCLENRAQKPACWNLKPQVSGLEPNFFRLEVGTCCEAIEGRSAEDSPGLMAWGLPPRRLFSNPARSHAGPEDGPEPFGLHAWLCLPAHQSEATQANGLA